MTVRHIMVLAWLIVIGSGCSPQPSYEPIDQNQVAKVGEVGKFDWPRWRGPNNDAVCSETGLLKEWPKAGPPIVWTAKGLGIGFGTRRLPAATFSAWVHGTERMVSGL